MTWLWWVAFAAYLIGYCVALAPITVIVIGAFELDYNNEADVFWFAAAGLIALTATLAWPVLWLGSLLIRLMIGIMKRNDGIRH